MIVSRSSGGAERRIVTGMIISREVLARVAARWEPDAEMFRSKWANTVGELCVAYFKNYNKAPRRNIAGLFEAWATERKRDRESVDLVEQFLTGLSSEYESTKEELNPAHVIDIAGEHFNSVKLSRLADQIKGFVDLGKVSEAESVLAEHRKVNLGSGGYIDVLQDEAALDKAFAEKEEPLLRLPEGLGRFYGHSLKRTAFISLLAPEKVGKTTNLVDLAWRSMLHRLRVAFFSLGDESEDEMMLRFAQRASRRPLYAGTERFPTSLTPKGLNKIPGISWDEWTFQKGLTVKTAKNYFAKTCAEKLKSDKSYLRLAVHPAHTMSMGDIDQQLDEWERDGYVADVIVTDYMENVRESGNPRDEPRFRISATWSAARGLAMKRHALKLTATQANTAANKTAYMTRDNFSESKTKLAHVTGMVGINQTDDEKALGVSRLNWVVRRGAFFVNARCCWCAGNVGIQSPSMISVY